MFSSGFLSPTFPPAWLRPAVVLAEVDRNDWVLCQVTSNRYADGHAVEITETDFASGALMRTSFARPGKLFSANNSLMQRVVGNLNEPKLAAVVDAVITILRPAK